MFKWFWNIFSLGAPEDLIDLKLWDFYCFSVVPPQKLRFSKRYLFSDLKVQLFVFFVHIKLTFGQKKFCDKPYWILRYPSS